MKKLPLAGRFVRADIIRAYHMFRVDWQADLCFIKPTDRDRHGRREPTLQEVAGQLHRMGFDMHTPVDGIRLCDLTGVSGNAAKFYDALCQRFGHATNPELSNPFAQ